MKDKISKIKEILENEIKPTVAAHSGDFEFAGFENGTVKIKMKGACRECPFKAITLKSGIEKILKSRISQVKTVEEA